MSTKQIQVIDYGGGNLGSVLRALLRLKVSHCVVSESSHLSPDMPILLPGVGSFAGVMKALDEKGFTPQLVKLISMGVPYLGICVGLQILFERSEESPDVQGLGIISGSIRKLKARKVPQIGWNHITADLSHSTDKVPEGDVYFVNSYVAEVTDRDCVLYESIVDADRFCAGIATGNITAYQFHPEKSGDFGHQLLHAWASAVGVIPQSEISREATRPQAESDGARLRKRIIPCLDVKDGRVLKGVNFQGLRDVGDPVAMAEAYQSQGADELVFLDISASHEGRETMRDVVARVADVLMIPFTVGGGVASLEQARALLQAGADKVAVNTAAVERPELVKEIADVFGSQCCVLAVDAQQFTDTPNTWQVLTHGGRTATGQDALGWITRAVALGAGEVLLTSWDKDGTRSGFDLPLTRAVSQQVAVPVIASGGANDAQHFIDVFELAEADAALAASIFHDGDMTVDGLKKVLLEKGLPIRSC